LPPVRCASAGAERPECGLRADPAYVVIPQAKKIGLRFDVGPYIYIYIYLLMWEVAPA
jgi:hypothetical protein